MFLLGFPVAKLSYYITIMIRSCLEIIGVSYGTITLLLRDTVLLLVASLDLKGVSSKC